MNTGSVAGDAELGTTGAPRRRRWAVVVVLLVLVGWPLAAMCGFSGFIAASTEFMSSDVQPDLASWATAELAGLALLLLPVLLVAGFDAPRRRNWVYLACVLGVLWTGQALGAAANALWG